MCNSNETIETTNNYESNTFWLCFWGPWKISPIYEELKGKTPDDFDITDFNKYIDSWNALWWANSTRARNEKTCSITSVLEYAADSDLKWHIHSVICSKTRLKFEPIRKLWPSVHNDKRFYTYEESYAYLCKSGEKYKEKINQHIMEPRSLGNFFKTKADRSMAKQDEDIMQAINHNVPLEDILMQSLRNCQRRDTITFYYDLVQKKNLPLQLPVYTEYHYGYTGVGKSEYVRQKLIADGVYNKEGFLKMNMKKDPFGDYNWLKHKVIWIDEFSPECLYNDLFDRHTLLKMMAPETRQSFPSRHKNKDLKAWDTIYICSVYAPEEIFPNLSATDNSQQFIRRLNKIVYHFVDENFIDSKYYDDPRRYKTFELDNPKENYKGMNDLISKIEQFYGRKLISGVLKKETI